MDNNQAEYGDTVMEKGHMINCILASIEILVAAYTEN